MTDYGHESLCGTFITPSAADVDHVVAIAQLADRVVATKPRMLELTGRAADGWIVSLGYLSGGTSDLAALNRQIDAGALDAGRQPAAVRRLRNVGGAFSRSRHGFLNGPPAQWVEELTAVALEDGMNGFILASDDAATIQHFAEEVVPAARALIASERAAAVRLRP